MRESVARSLRRWAIAGVIYSAALADLAIEWIPFKTPIANALILLYALAHFVGAVGLWRRARWGWRLSVLAHAVGLVAMLFVVAGLVASWAYLRAIFGDFGRGASIGALLFASVALQILGLYPALGLTSLLRQEAREDMGGGRWWRALFLGALLPLITGWAVDARYRLSAPPPEIPQAAREASLAHLRAALQGAPRPSLDHARGYAVGQGPLYVTLYDGGAIKARVTGEGGDLAAAVAQAADALAQHPKLLGRREEGGRLKIDRIIAEGPILPFALALSVNPGLDGLRVTAGATSKTLLPDDLIRLQRFGAAPLVPGIEELRLGLDVAAVHARLGQAGRLTRLRVEGWVEHEGRALNAKRGNTPLEEGGPASWRAAAIAGGDFILRQLKQDGSFHYQYYPYTNTQDQKGGYSLPRHAGTVYALALLYGLTGEARFKVGAQRGIAYLNARIPARCAGRDMACVARGNTATLGSVALSAVGMLEYQRRTHDARYAPTIRRLIAFIRFVQKEDGDFYHAVNIKTGKVGKRTRKMFFSEEAALALVMAHEVLGDPEDLAAAQQALSYLTGPKYRSFLGRFIYGADHWTCIAAEEAWPRLKDAQYINFCRGYAGLIRRLQYGGGGDNGDFEGHYGFGVLTPPQAPAAAGFSEAILSTMALSHQHGLPASALEAQARAALDALARDQIREENSWLMSKPAAAVGGVRRSLVESEGRIDFTQHSVAALIRGAALFDKPSGAPSSAK
ncbi:hypothetical protein KJ940_02940 [Myxococcota bacterium]|nr:hypothetical protein [Myxococcota bacterium]